MRCEYIVIHFVVEPACELEFARELHDPARELWTPGRGHGETEREDGGEERAIEKRR